MSPQSAKILDCTPETRYDWRTRLTDNPVNKEGIAATQRALDSGETQPPYELELRTFAERVIWVEVNEAPVVENGTTVALSVRSPTFTDRKHLDEERRKAQKLESLGILAGGIAHDFNNLLMAILGNISLAKHYLRENDQALEQIEKPKMPRREPKTLPSSFLPSHAAGCRHQEHQG